MSDTTSEIKLRQMICDSTAEIESLTGSIEQLDLQIDELNERDDAIDTALCDVATDDLNSYLENPKLGQIEALYSVNAYVDPASGNQGYGNTLTDWAIRDTTTGDVVYSVSVNWDNDPDLTQWMDDWDFGNDYLTRPLNTGATYGIRPFRSAIQTARSILVNNRQKLIDSQTVFEPYASDDECPEEI